jgi:flagellar basal body-associated protein FliL
MYIGGMFHWICPECGREIPPAIKECPACDPRAVAQPALETHWKEPLELAPVLVAPPREPLGNAPAAPATATLLQTPWPLSEPAPGPPVSAVQFAPDEPVSLERGPTESDRPKPDSPELDQPDLRAAESSPASTSAAQPPPAPVSPAEPSSTEPLSIAAAGTPDLVDLAAALGCSMAPASASQGEAPAAQALEAAPEAEPSGNHDPQFAANLFPTPEPDSASNSQPAIEVELAVEPLPEPTSLSLTPERDQPPEAQPSVESVTALEPEKTAADNLTTVASIPALELQPAAPALAQDSALLAGGAEPVSEPAAMEPEPPQPASALPLPGRDLKPRAPQAALPQPPQPILAPPPPPAGKPAAAPRTEASLPLAALQGYRAAAQSRIRPAAPPAKSLTPGAGPRITLPGPALPPQLRSLKDAGLAQALPGGASAEHRRSTYGWLVSLLVMLVLLTAGGGVVFLALSRTLPGRAEAGHAAPPQVRAATATPVAQPLSRSVEVTGFRFLINSNKPSEIHYLVVNHSAAALNGVTVYVTVRTQHAKAGQPPVCHFSFRAPDLGPFEAREMISPIEKVTRPASLPSWQDLKAEVEIAE